MAFIKSEPVDDDDAAIVIGVSRLSVPSQQSSASARAVFVLDSDDDWSDDDYSTAPKSAARRGRQRRASAVSAASAAAAAVPMEEDVAPKSAHPRGRGRGAAAGATRGGAGGGVRRATPGRPPKAQGELTAASEYMLIKNEVAKLSGQVSLNLKLVNAKRDTIQRDLNGSAHEAQPVVAGTATNQAELDEAANIDEAQLASMSAEQSKEMRLLQALQLDKFSAPIQVKLMEGNTASLAEYFRQARANGFMEANGKGSSAHIVNGGENDSPFYSSRLGTQLQNPGANAADQAVISKEGQLAAAQRNLAARKQRELHMNIAQINARAFYTALSEAQRTRALSSQRPGLKSAAAATSSSSSSDGRQIQLATPKLEIGDVNDACKVSFDDFPVCRNGTNCVGVTVLVPQLSGAKSPLRCWCTPSEYALFLKEGIMPKSTTHGQCLPCMMEAFTSYIYERRQSNTGGQLDQPPFTVHVERVGGFTRDSVLSCERLGSDFPAFNANMFVPCVSLIQRNLYNPDLGRSEQRTVAVYGYEMSADVCYAGIDSGRNSKMVNIVNPLHSAYCSLGSQLSQTPYEALAKLLCDSHIAQSYASGTEEKVFDVKCWLEALCCPFSETLHFIELDNNTNALHRALFPLISTALAEFGEGVTQLLSSQDVEDVIPASALKNASVCTALMARMGLVLTMSGLFKIVDEEQVCTAYSDSHKALVKFVVSKWNFTGVMPNNSTLYGAALAGRPTYDVLEAFLRRENLYPEVKSLDMVRDARDLHKVTRELVINHRTNGFSHMKHVALRFLPNGILTNMTTGRNACVLFAEVEKLCANNGTLASNTALLEILVYVFDIIPPLHACCKVLVFLFVAALQEDISTSARLLKHGASMCYSNLRVSTVRRLLGSRLDDTLKTLLCSVDDAARVSSYSWLVALALRVTVLYRLADFVAERYKSSLETNTVTKLGKDDAFRLMTPESRSSSLLQESICIGEQFIRYLRKTKTCANFTGSHYKMGAARKTPLHPLGAAISALVDGSDECQKLQVEQMITNSCDSLYTNHVDAVFGTDEAASDFDDTVRYFDFNKHKRTSIGHIGKHKQCDAQELAYRIRCAIFEHLGLFSALFTDARQPLSDVALQRRRLVGSTASVKLHDSYIGPAPSVVACQDSMADLAPLLPYTDLLTDRQHGDVRTQDISNSWIPHISTCIPLVCFVRDFERRLKENCRTTQYMRWVLQSVLITLLGTYRHVSCLDSVLKFSHAARLFNVFSLDSASRNESTRERVYRLCASPVVIDTLILTALRENVAVQLHNSTPFCSIVQRVWQCFREIQQVEIPHRADRARYFIATRLNDGPMADILYTCNAELRSDEIAERHQKATNKTAERPIVFRRLDHSFPTLVISEFEDAEIEYWTQEVVNHRFNNSVPPIFNIIPEPVMLFIMHRVMQTRRGEPLTLKLLLDVGVSARCALLMYVCNMMYTHRGRGLDIEPCILAMSKEQYYLVWFVMHVYRIHQSVCIDRLPLEMHTRQVDAIRRRANMPKSDRSQLPSNFCNIMFCNILGCARPCTLFVPRNSKDSYGTDDTAYSTRHNAVVCVRRRDENMLTPVARRLNNTDLGETVKEYNSRRLRALQSNHADLFERLEFRVSADQSMHALQTSQGKVIRTVVAVMFQLACKEDRVRLIPGLGRIVTVTPPSKREPRHCFAYCESCGALSQHSSDRYLEGRFYCGHCNYTQRRIVNGTMCISCSKFIMAEEPFLLSGETEAKFRGMSTTTQADSETKAATVTPAKTTPATAVASSASVPPDVDRLMPTVKIRVLTANQTAAANKILTADAESATKKRKKKSVKLVHDQKNVDELDLLTLNKADDDDDDNSADYSAPKKKKQVTFSGVNNQSSDDSDTEPLRDSVDEKKPAEKERRRKPERENQHQKMCLISLYDNRPKVGFRRFMEFPVCEACLASIKTPQISVLGLCAETKRAVEKAAVFKQHSFNKIAWTLQKPVRQDKVPGLWGQ